MKKAIVIGCPGGGKSTFARELEGLTKLPLYYLDMLYWNEDKTTVPRTVFLERLEEVLKTDSWIIDGNYLSSMERRIVECDTVFFLDYDLDVCLEGVKMRKGKKRPDMPWVETEDDEEFLEFIRKFKEHSRPNILELLKKYSHKKIIIFKARNESNEWLTKFDIDNGTNKS